MYLIEPEEGKPEEGLNLFLPSLQHTQRTRRGGRERERSVVCGGGEGSVVGGGCYDLVVAMMGGGRERDRSVVCGGGEKRETVKGWVWWRWCW